MKLDCHNSTCLLSKAASKLPPLAACACLAGILFALVVPSTATASATEQAEQADEAGQPGATAASQSPPEIKTVSSNSIREYEEQVHQLQSRFDAYHGGLSEAMMGLGLAHQQQGDHEEAIPLFEQALQINRVNHGLYHTNKIPLIEHLIVSYAATGDWGAVEDRYFTLMQLYSRNYDNNDLELLPGLAKLTEWHLRAFNAELTEEPIANLMLAREFILQSINIIRYNYGADDLRQLDPFAALVLTDFYLAVQQTQLQGEMPRSTFNSFREESGPVFLDSGNYHQSMFAQGRRHLEEMVQITQTNTSAPPRMSIDTLVMLADWNLVFKQKMTADQIYRQAWEQTMTLEDHERHLEEIFNQPVSLPSIKISGFTDSGAADSEKGDDSAVQDSGGNTNGLGAIVFEFDISTSGRAVDPELVQADPGAAQATINNARRRLKSSRFRPRYENGVAVDNLNARIRYRFEPDPESIPAEADNAE